MAEDVEVLRRLLATRLGAMSAISSGALQEIGVEKDRFPAVTLGDSVQFTNTADVMANQMFDYVAPTKSTVSGNRYGVQPEGTYLKGYGVVYTVTLPAAHHRTKPQTDKPAPTPLSEWERTRKELRGEKVEAPPAASEPPSLADVILKVLAENGRHLALLEPEESITVVVTFRPERPAPLSTFQPSAGPGMMPGMPGAPPAASNAIGSGAAGTAEQPAQIFVGGFPGFDKGPPSTALDYLLLGELHLKQRQFEQAAECFRQALKRQSELPNQAPEIHRKLAEAYLGLGQLDQARTSLEAAGPSSQKPSRPKTPLSAMKPELPGKLVVAGTKKLLDQVGAGKMTFEEFKKAATVDSYGVEK
jgi:hypothetical protein